VAVPTRTSRFCAGTCYFLWRGFPGHSAISLKEVRQLHGSTRIPCASLQRRAHRNSDSLKRAHSNHPVDFCVDIVKGWRYANAGLIAKHLADNWCIRRKKRGQSLPAKTRQSVSFCEGMNQTSMQCIFELTFADASDHLPHNRINVTY
jgi:hypothetical protein